MGKQDRKTERWKNEEASKFAAEPTVAEAKAAAEQRHVDLMTGPEAPEWARVTVNPTLIAGPPRADIAARLARLETEQADAQATLARLQEEERTVLNAQLDQRRADEEKIQAAQALPNKLHDALKMVQSFRPATESAPVPTPADHIARGNLRERVAPALAQAAQMQAEIEKWEKAVGKTLDTLYTEDENQRSAVDDLMRGVPATHPNVSLVTNLLKSVRQLVDLKAGLQKTISRETTALEHIVSGIDRRGSMEVSGDRSAAWYSLEREVVGTLAALATVNADAVAALWTGVNGVMARLEALARIRAEHAGEVVKPLEWHNVGAILDAADVAKRTGETVYGDAPGGRPHVGASWSVFDKETK